jgi:Asp-tRNA(Asn)/Glu-tRNA(Gln) amidotransferase A subunit family amidase
MARTVEDVDLLFRAVAGFDRGDAMASPVPLHQIAPEGVRHLRVGYLEEHPDFPVTAETRAGVLRAASALRDSGFHVEPAHPELREIFLEARRHWWTLFVRLAAELLVPEFLGREQEISTILTYSDRAPTKQDLLNAWFDRDKLRLRLAQQMSRFPILVCPVASVPAFRHGEREWNIAGKQVSYMDAMSYTQWFNFLGNPALVLPVAQSPGGLPIGVQIVGEPNAEEVILTMGGILEQALGSSRHSPFMAAN